MAWPDLAWPSIDVSRHYRYLHRSFLFLATRISPVWCMWLHIHWGAIIHKTVRHFVAY